MNSQANLLVRIISRKYLMEILIRAKCLPINQKLISEGEYITSLVQKIEIHHEMCNHQEYPYYVW